MSLMNECRLLCACDYLRTMNGKVQSVPKLAVSRSGLVDWFFGQSRSYKRAGNGVHQGRFNCQSKSNGDLLEA